MSYGPRSNVRLMFLIVAFAVFAVALVMISSDDSDAAGETSGTCGDSLTWSIDTSTGILTIDGTGAMTDYSLYSTRWGGHTVNSVIFLNDVTTIGQNAFRGCSALTAIYIPNTVTHIYSGAFTGCTSLSTVMIGQDVVYIDNNAFEECPSISNISVAMFNTAYTVDDDVLFNMSKTKLLKCSVSKTDVAYAVPGTVTEICPYAFEGTSFTVINIPADTSIIGFNAFVRCSNLSVILVNESNTTYRATLGTQGVLFKLDGTVAKRLICYPGANVQSSYTIPDTVVNIEESAFRGNQNLETVTFGSSVKTVGSNAFRDSAKLSTVTMSDSVRTIGFNAFSGCANLETIDFANGVEIIGNEAFSDCPKIATISLPSTVDYILSGVFSNCTGLTSLTISAGVVSIGSKAFSGCTNLTTISIPASTSTIGDKAFVGCSKLTAIDIPEGNSNYSSVGGCLLNKAKTTLLVCPEGLETYTLPTTVTTVDPIAFSGGKIKDVTFPAGITVTVSTDSFHDCTALNTIHIVDGANVTFENDGIKFSDSAEHKINVDAPDGFTIDTTSYTSNVKLLYGEPPSNPEDDSDKEKDPENEPSGSGPDMMLIVAIVVVVVAVTGIGIGVFVYIKKK